MAKMKVCSTYEKRYKIFYQKKKRFPPFKMKSKHQLLVWLLLKVSLQALNSFLFFSSLLFSTFPCTYCHESHSLCSVASLSVRGKKEIIVYCCSVAQKYLYVYRYLHREKSRKSSNRSSIKCKTCTNLNLFCGQIV